MVTSSFSLFLALLALGFLVFIHELGHYLAARWVGMRVETFSIGFGKPIVSWYRDGVKWQIGWLPFGGFVSIAGSSQEGDIDPYDIPDGFFGGSPWARIKVSLAGPLVNLAFAFLAFAGIWALGGRTKSYSELTQRVGWVDETSELYRQGVRPGDRIVDYDGHPVRHSRDHFYAAMMGDDEVVVRGFHVDHDKGGEPRDFTYRVKTYQHPQIMKAGVRTAGILEPANYVIYDRLPNGKENPLPDGSPLANSGIQYGDRLFWIDGEIVMSLYQMRQILNDNRVLATIQRGDETLLARVPRVQVLDLKLTRLQRDEISDWQFAAGLSEEPLNKLFMLPYNLTNEGVVEERLVLLEKEDKKWVFPKRPGSAVQAPLRAGDRIVAIDGKPVGSSFELVQAIQNRQVHVIVDRGEDYDRPVTLEDSDAEFDHFVDWTDLGAIASSIGTGTVLTDSGALHLLKPVVPLRREDFPMAKGDKQKLTEAFERQHKAVEALPRSDQRDFLLKQLEKQRSEVYLGLSNARDRKVQYNPSPDEAFGSVFSETLRTLQALLSGYLEPKWMSGPVGIVTVIHQQSALGIKEALFWLGFISLNLGMLNLLPIPVLDGGYICLSLYEAVSGHKLGIKTIERLIIPFALGLMALFIYLTYNDVSRIVEMFWR